MTCSAPASGSPPPSPAPTTGPGPTPPPRTRRSPASGGSSPRSTATSPVWARKNAQPSAKPSPSSASTAPSASAFPASARARRHPWRRPHDRHLAAERRRHAGHRDDQRPAGRLRPPPPARHHRYQPGHRGRDRDQRLRHRPHRRRRPHLPLPAPRPAGENPRPRSRPARRNRNPPPGRPPPPATAPPGPAVPRAPLQADLLAAHERALRLPARTRQLEKRLSEALGEQAWRESGLGAPADIDALHQKITHLEQQAADLQLQLDERDQDLNAARAANRELMTQLNHISATTRR